MLILQLDQQQLSDLIKNAVREVKEETPEKNQPEELEKPMTVREASEYLSLSVPTIYTLISKGELPVKKRSKRCYFFASDLNNYLRAGGRKRNIENDPKKDPVSKGNKKRIVNPKQITNEH